MTARVFHQKLKELLNDIVEKEAFGKPLAYVYVIEFQKRGLPHCHILIILNYNSKPLSPDDKFVSAEIPDASKLPILHSLVRSHMIHGPCGEANKNSPCMKDNKCSKRFPKQFCERTFQSTDGYPKYSRRDNGITVEKNGIILDNRWVVPYNPFLLSKYTALIKVEICTSVSAVNIFINIFIKDQIESWPVLYKMNLTPQ